MATLAKCERYHRWGVPFCRIVDPEKRIVWVYNKDGERAKLSRSDPTLALPVW